MTKQEMLERIYNYFTAFYGVKVQPGYKVRRLSKENVSWVYENVFLVCLGSDNAGTVVAYTEAHLNNIVLADSAWLTKERKVKAAQRKRQALERFSEELFTSLFGNEE